MPSIDPGLESRESGQGVAGKGGYDRIDSRFELGETSAKRELALEILALPVFMTFTLGVSKFGCLEGSLAITGR